MMLDLGAWASYGSTGIWRLSFAWTDESVHLAMLPQFSSLVLGIACAYSIKSTTLAKGVGCAPSVASLREKTLDRCDRA